MAKIKFNIRSQVALLILFPVAFLSIAFALLYHAQYAQHSTQDIKQLGKLYSRLIMPQVKNALLNNDTKGLSHIAKHISKDHSIIGMGFYSPNGKLLTHYGNDLGFQDIILPISNLETSPKQTIQKINEYTFHFITSVMHKGNIIGWLTLDIDNKYIVIQYYRMHFITIGLICLGCILALLSYIYLTRKILHPISRLRRSMQQILRNEFETQIKTLSSGDMGMIERGCVHLQKQYLTLQKEFNQAIEVATADLQQSLELLEEKNVEISLSRKKIEERNQQKSEFIANMSHEIRTPMNGIIGFTHMLLESSLNPLQQDYVKTIHASAQDLLRIINDILDFSKMDAGKLNLDTLPLNIRNCIDEVLALNAPIANKKGLELIPTTDIAVPHKMLGDPIRIKQLLNNLISNAIKYTDHGYVLIRSTLLESSEKTYTISIAITDTGMGISAEEKAILFNAYAQINNTVTRRNGGTGLGLVICKKLAEHMNGSIRLVSEPAKGTTFTVVLKLLKLPAFEVVKNQLHRFAALKVICFEENPLHMEALCNGLGTWGVQSIQVSTIQELPKALAKHSDCNLAFINVNQGFESTIQDIITKQNIPCVLISKWYLPHFAEIGAKALLFKPPNIQKLYDTLESFLKLPSPKYTLQQPLQKLRAQLSELKANILIAEDNPTNRLLFESWLKNYATTYTAPDGVEAVKACSYRRYSAILLDLQMPNLNGIEAALQIRQQSNLNINTPIFIISASQNKFTNTELKKLEIDCCLEKPVTEERLLQLLIENIQKNRLINWELCLQKVSGDAILAAEFLHHFTTELTQHKNEFMLLHSNNDIQKIENLAHKLHGACCFTGVIQLQKNVADLEAQAKNATSIGDLSPYLSQLIHSIDSTLEEYEHVHKKKIMLLLEKETI